MMTAAAALLITADLFSAIRAQDLKEVESLLSQDPALASKRDENGASPVGAALGARKGNGFVPRKENRILEAILRRDPPLSPHEVAAVGTAAQVRAEIAKSPEFVRTVSRNGWTPLHYAAFADNAESAVALLDAGADVNARARNKFDNSPLQVSLLTSSREVAGVLLARGADVNARQGEGVTALHEAASSGDLEIIRMLLAAGADVDAASAQFGTPRELALKNNHEEAARLLAAGAEQPLAVLPDALKWEKPFGPHGMSLAFVVGKLGDKNPASYFIKFPAGRQTGWHIHTNDYEAVVLKGTFAAQQQGEEEKKLPAGSFFTQPGKRNHRNHCLEGEECMIFIHYEHGADGQPVTPDGKPLPPSAAADKK